jgi:bacterial/archaeal transporter family protein
MNSWALYACIAVLCWGTVGLLQKLGTNRISSRSLLIWLIVGFAALLPLLWRGGNLSGLSWRVLLVGLLGGAANGLGSWALFEALEKGAKASVAVPLTALYPLVTIVLAQIFLTETLTLRQWVGIALAVIGGAMLSYETERPVDLKRCNSESITQ